MSVFKKFKYFIDSRWCGSSFIKNDIEQYFRYDNNDYITSSRYLKYYIDAGFIEKIYVLDSIDSSVKYKIKEHIPNSYQLTIKQLKKLSDKKYKETYIRKAKIDLLKFKTKYLQ